jgi:hypothetical protein
MDRTPAAFDAVTVSSSSQPVATNDESSDYRDSAVQGKGLYNPSHMAASVLQSSLTSPPVAPPHGDHSDADRDMTWNESLFVVDSSKKDESSADWDPSTGGASADEKRRRSSRQNKMQTLIVDQTMLQTRLEWNQLLVNKAFKPVSGPFLCTYGCWNETSKRIPSGYVCS